MTTPDLSQRVMNTLTDLGLTEKVVAENLSKAGATGKRGSANDCPVSHYLTDSGFGPAIRVSPSQVSVVVGSLGIQVLPPVPVTNFIRSFDHGRYGELVDGVIDGWQASTERGEA